MAEAAISPIAIKNQWFDTYQAATRLGLSPSTVRRLCKSGKITYFRCGRDFRILGSDLFFFMKQHRHEVTPPTDPTN